MSLWKLRLQLAVACVLAFCCFRFAESYICYVPNQPLSSDQLVMIRGSQTTDPCMEVGGFPCDSTRPCYVSKNTNCNGTCASFCEKDTDIVHILEAKGQLRKNPKDITCGKEYKEGTCTLVGGQFGQCRCREGAQVSDTCTRTRYQNTCG